ncbi:MAG: class I SAM-dependent methyltransferase, partial [Gammaproteobacteria bacterium]
MDASPALDIFDPTFVKDIFQDMAGKYWVNDFCSLGLANRWRELAIRAIRLPQGAAVCDLMTGTGEALPFLLKFIGSEGRVVAVDFSGRMLDQAHERIKCLGAGNVSLVEEGIFSCSLPDTSFDAVTCMFGAKLIPVLQWTAFAALIARLLRPGGRFILLELG